MSESCRVPAYAREHASSICWCGCSPGPLRKVECIDSKLELNYTLTDVRCIQVIINHSCLRNIAIEFHSAMPPPFLSFGFPLEKCRRNLLLGATCLEKDIRRRKAGHVRGCTSHHLEMDRKWHLHTGIICARQDTRTRPYKLMNQNIFSYLFPGLYKDHSR